VTIPQICLELRLVHRSAIRAGAFEIRRSDAETILVYEVLIQRNIGFCLKSIDLHFLVKGALQVCVVAELEGTMQRQLWFMKF